MITIPRKAIVFVVASFLGATLIFSLYSVPTTVLAKSTKGPITCRPLYTLAGNAPHVQCCQTTTFPSGFRSTSCTTCDNTQPPSNCGPSYPGRAGSNPTVGPTQSGNGLNSTGAKTNGQSGLPGHLGTVLPSSGSNNTNTGTLPASTVTKEHNTSSPQVLSSTENPSNNQQTSGHHHHKGEPNGGTSSSGNTNNNLSNGGTSSGKSSNSNNNKK